MFSLQQNQRTRGQEGGTGSAWKPRWGWGMAQTIYIHVSKCKNDKIKKHNFR
jgi:hypothetical protein